MTCDTHVFGSRKGYQTLARSAGLSSDDERVLAQFGFGESSDERFLSGLATEPTAFARPLPSGRMAITRVLAGPLDDAGRPTLERRTVIVDRDAYAALRPGLAGLLADAGFWSSEAFLAGERVRLPATGGDAPVPGDRTWRLFDAWTVALQRPPSGVVAGSSDADADEVLALVASVRTADAHRLSWGIRLLSPIEWVDVLTLSRFGSLDGRRQVFGASAGDLVNPAVASVRRRGGDRLPSLASLGADAGSTEAIDPGSRARWKRGRGGAGWAGGSAQRARRRLMAGIVAMLLATGLVVAALIVRYGRTAGKVAAVTGIAAAIGGDRRTEGTPSASPGPPPPASPPSDSAPPPAAAAAQGPVMREPATPPAAPPTPAPRSDAPTKPTTAAISMPAPKSEPRPPSAIEPQLKLSAADSEELSALARDLRELRTLHRELWELMVIERPTIGQRTRIVQLMEAINKRREPQDAFVGQTVAAVREFTLARTAFCAAPDDVPGASSCAASALKAAILLEHLRSVRRCITPIPSWSLQSTFQHWQVEWRAPPGKEFIDKYLEFYDDSLSIDTSFADPAASDGQSASACAVLPPTPAKMSSPHERIFEWVRVRMDPHHDIGPWAATFRELTRDDGK